MSRLFWFALAILGVGLVLLVINNGSGRTFGLDNPDFARVVKYAALGMLAGAVLLNRRLRLSETLRNVALWLLVIVLLVAGYQYRYELQDIASRISAGLLPGSPLSMVDAEGRESVYVERGPGGHFEAEVTINGVPLRAVIDTGASSTVLTAEDARRVGLDPDALSYWVPVATANGRTEAARAEMREVAVGPISRSGVTVLVARAGALDRSLLGMNFIGTLSGFDMRGDRLILRD